MRYLNNKLLKQNLDFFLTVLVIFLCLFLSLKFPSNPGFQELTKNLFFLVIIPVLYIKFILGKKLSNFGINLKNKKTGITFSIILFSVMLLIFVFVIKTSSFKDFYNLPDYVVGNFWLFLVYEFIFVNFYLFVFDFFFRGFVLFSFSKYIGSWSIIVQLLFFILFLSLDQGLNAQNLPFLIIAVVSGVTTFNSQSFIFPYVSGFIFMFLLDAYLIHLIK